MRSCQNFFSPVILAAIFLVIASPQLAIAQGTPISTPMAGLSESTIKGLQEALNRQGIAVTVDGVLSDATRSAVRKYQSQHHLPVTGEPDKATLDKLSVADRQSVAPAQLSVLAQATPTPPGGSSSAQAQPSTPSTPQMPMQPGQMQGGMMMNCPMMQGQMQAMVKMMQGMMQMMQMMQGQMQPGAR
jgi:peptidoglycan hydrolase-like protein with peptidoglycan-binding domain